MDNANISITEKEGAKSWGCPAVNSQHKSCLRGSQPIHLMLVSSEPVGSLEPEIPNHSPYGNHCSGQSHCFLNLVHKFQFHASCIPQLVLFYINTLPPPKYPQWKRQRIQTSSEKILMVNKVGFILSWSWQQHSFNLILEVPIDKGYGYSKVPKILQSACE